MENIDFPATLLDFAGIDFPPQMQGRSFRPICETGREPADWKQEVDYRYWMHMAHHDNPGEMAIRTKTHKLIDFDGCDCEGENQTPPAWELDDLRQDPEQMRNLYDDPSHAAVRDDLKVRLARLRVRIGDDGSHFPACEQVVQAFWDYDEADRQQAIRICAEFRSQREAALAK